MKKQSIILLLILFSLGSGALGAYGVLFLSQSDFLSHQKTETHSPETQIKTQENFPSSKEGEIQGGVLNLEDIQSQITSTAKKVSPSVVSIVIKKDLVIYRSDPWGFFQEPAGTISRKVGGGSGFFITKDGIILTNKHVVGDTSAVYTVILSDGTEYDAKLLATDPLNDLALIQILDSNKDFIPLPIISGQQNIEIGQFSIAVGNALAEFQNSVSFGIISGKNRTIEAGNETLNGLLQTDAAINLGNSGGPLLDLSGNVIGINTAIASGGNGIGFAIALTQEKLDYILKSISEYGRIKRPFIGINYIPNSVGVAQELGLTVDYGAYIVDEKESVIPESSAAKAGLEPGDIILEINNKKIESHLSLGSFIQNAIPGEVLSLKVLKKSGEERVMQLELGEY